MDFSLVEDTPSLDTYQLASDVADFNLSLEGSNPQHSSNISMEASIDFQPLGASYTAIHSMSSHFSSNDGGQSLHDLVTCCLCAERIKPSACFKSCQHAFCECCFANIVPASNLKKHPDNREDGAETHLFSDDNGCQSDAGVSIVTVKCPVCTTPVDVVDIGENELYSRIIEQETQMEKSAKCVQCGSAAEQRCVDCKQDYCGACQQTHCNLPVCRNHEFHALNNVHTFSGGPSSPLDLPTYCSRHPSRTIEYNCTECEQPICEKCFVLEHSKHAATGHVEEVDEANARLGRQVAGHLITVQEQIEQMTLAASKYGAQARAIVETASKEKKIIQSVMDQSIRQIQERGKDLMLQIDSAAHDQIRPLYIRQEEAEETARRRDHFKTFTDNIIKNTAGGTKLTQLQGKIIPRLDGMVTEDFRQHEMSVQHVVFLPNPQVQELVKLGEVKLREPIRMEDNNNVGRQDRGSAYQDEGEEDKWEEASSSPISGEYHEYTPLPPRMSISMTTHKMESFLAHLETFELPRASPNLSHLARNEITSTKTFSVNNFCYQLCVVNGEVWLPCPLEGNIVVHSAEDGELKRTIAPIGMISTRSIVPLDDGRFVAACSNGLFVTDATFQHPNCIHIGSFADVFIADGHIYVLDCAQNRVKIFTRQSYGWFTTTFSIKAVRISNNDRIRVTARYIYISCVNDATITVATKHGQFVTSYPVLTSDSESSFKFNKPYLCQVDENGSMLVADNSGGGLKVCSGDGDMWEWETGRMDHAYDVMFEDEQTIWVLCGDAVKRTNIHRFTLL